MKMNLIVKLALPLTIFATNAQQLVIPDFYQHPTHCKQFLGGTEYQNDGATREFGEAFANAISEQVKTSKTVNEALKEIENRCRANQGKK